MSEDKLDQVELLSINLHEIYMKEAERQGNNRNAKNYFELPENVKEYDRVLARYILERITALELKIKELERDNQELRNKIDYAAKHCENYHESNCIDILEQVFKKGDGI